jgi:excisionase family DNA binding protein
MNIKEAAEYLNISVKTLERKIAGGDISVAYVTGATGKQRTFERTELDRFKDAEAAKAETTSYVARPRVAASAVSSSQGLQRTGGGQGIEAFVSMITDALQANVAQGNDHARSLSPADLAHKMTLSFKEASRLSGVPESHLRTAYADGALRGAKIGRGVRVTPDDVRKYVEGRMKAKKRG